ncbi:MAG: alpha/beta hydrolase [Rhodothermales bacterium]
METLSISGASLHYAERGAGDPIVFVHGSAGDMRTWGGQLAFFASRYRAIAYSRRYHWPNAPIAEGGDYTLRQHIEDLEAVLRALDAAPAHLVGHSYGGVICLMLAARSPDLVRSIVLAEPPVLGMLVGVPPNPIELLRLAIKSPRTAAGIFKLGAFGLGPATAASRRGDMEAVLRLTGTAILGEEAFRALSPERLQQVKDNLIREELLSPGFMPRLPVDAVRSVRAPALLVGASRSPNVFACLLDELSEVLPHTRRASIPFSSHIMHEDNTPAYNQAVLSFLEQ